MFLVEKGITSLQIVMGSSQIDAMFAGTALTSLVVPQAVGGIEASAIVEHDSARGLCSSEGCDRINVDRRRSVQTMN